MGLGAKGNCFMTVFLVHWGRNERAILKGELGMVAGEDYSMEAYTVLGVLFILRFIIQPTFP